MATQVQQLAQRLGISTPQAQSLINQQQVSQQPTYIQPTQEEISQQREQYKQQVVDALQQRKADLLNKLYRVEKGIESGSPDYVSAELDAVSGVIGQVMAGNIQPEDADNYIEVTTGNRIARVESRMREPQRQVEPTQETLVTSPLPQLSPLGKSQVEIPIGSGSNGGTLYYNRITGETVERQDTLKILRGERQAPSQFENVAQKSFVPSAPTSLFPKQEPSINEINVGEDRGIFGILKSIRYNEPQDTIAGLFNKGKQEIQKVTNFLTFPSLALSENIKESGQSYARQGGVTYFGGRQDLKPYESRGTAIMESKALLDEELLKLPFGGGEEEFARREISSIQNKLYEEAQSIVDEKLPEYQLDLQSYSDVLQNDINSGLISVDEANNKLEARRIQLEEKLKEEVDKRIKPLGDELIAGTTLTLTIASRNRRIKEAIVTAPVDAVTGFALGTVGGLFPKVGTLIGGLFEANLAIESPQILKELKEAPISTGVAMGITATAFGLGGFAGERTTGKIRTQYEVAKALERAKVETKVSAKTLDLLAVKKMYNLNSNEEAIISNMLDRGFSIRAGESRLVVPLSDKKILPEVRAVFLEVTSRDGQVIDVISLGKIISRKSNKEYVQEVIRDTTSVLDSETMQSYTRSFRGNIKDNSRFQSVEEAESFSETKFKTERENPISQLIRGKTEDKLIREERLFREFSILNLLSDRLTTLKKPEATKRLLESARGKAKKELSVSSFILRENLEYIDIKNKPIGINDVFGSIAIGEKGAVVRVKSTKGLITTIFPKRKIRKSRNRLSEESKVNLSNNKGLSSSIFKDTIVNTDSYLESPTYVGGAGKGTSLFYGKGDIRSNDFIPNIDRKSPTNVLQKEGGNIFSSGFDYEILKTAREIGIKGRGIQPLFNFIRTKGILKTDTSFGIRSILQQQVILKKSNLFSTREIPNTLTDLRTETKTKTDLFTTENLSLGLRREQRQQQRLSYGFRFAPIGLDITKPEVKIPKKIITPEEEETDNNRVQAYQAQVKSKGKFIRINKQPLDLQDAVSFGARFVDENPEAQFRVTPIKGKRIDKPKKQDNYFSQNKYKFRQFIVSPKRQVKGRRLPTLTFIENRRYRFDSAGEQRGRGRRNRYNNRIKNIFGF